MKKVLISQRLHEDAMAMLEGKYDILLPSEPGQAAFDALLPEAEAIILRTNVKANEDVFEKAKNLKILCRTGVGVDNVDLAAAKKHNVIVCNTPLANSISVAEHVVALILSLSKNLTEYDRETRQGNWAVRSSGKPFEISGKTFGLIGLGNTGRIAARMLHGSFEMKIIAYDPFCKQEDFPNYTLTTDVEDVFRNADIISMHCPSIPATKGIVNKKNIALCKKGVMFINCARGDVIVEADVAEALRDGTFLAAGLDVFHEEPISKDNPFLGLNNALLTPHSAALTQEATIRVATTAVEQMILYFEGKNPQFVVK